MDYRILFLIFATLHLIYSLLTSLLSMQSIGKPIPECVNDIYDNETYDKYRHYQKEKDVFSIVKAIVSFLCTLAFYLSPLLSSLSASISNPFVCALAILGCYILFTIIIDTPFEYYGTYVIEEKYGFNKTKGKTFVGDIIKNVVISFILLYALIALYISLYRAIGLYSILLISGILFIFIVLMNLLSPILVQINFKKTPLEEGELRSKLTDLLQSEGYEVKDIYVVDGSKRSTKANAFFTGIGKLKSIMLYDTLIDLMTPEEICAVFAHELGHGKHKDTAKNVVLSFLNLALLVSFLVLITYLVDTTGFVNIDSSHYAFLFLLYMEIIMPVYLTLFGILSSTSSRRAEYRADQMAKEKGYGEALVSALKKLGLNSYSNLTPNKFIVFMSYSHPTLEERINAIRK